MSSIDSSINTQNQATVGSVPRQNEDSQPSMPSETVEPTEVQTPSQQANTMPQSGNVVHVIQPAAQPTFGQKVVGYAKEVRGTVLRKPTLKEEGEKIVRGEEPWPPTSADQDGDASMNNTAETAQ